MCKNFLITFVAWGALIIVGYGHSSAQSDTLWTRTYGGEGSDFGNSARLTSDGGYIFCGGTGSFGEGGDAYIIKTDENGDTLWTKNYGGSGWDDAISVREISDGNYAFIGFTDYDPLNNSGNVYLVKINSNGDTLWTRTHGGEGEITGHSFQQTSDDGFIIVGRAPSPDNSEKLGIYLIKTDESGDTVWTKKFGSDTYDWYGESIQQTADGGYIIGGGVVYWTNRADFLLIKTDANGDTLWTRTYGGSGFRYCYSLIQASDGSYILAGSDYINGTLSISVIKTDEDGEVVWSNRYHAENSWVTMLDGRETIKQTQDGGYIIAGTCDTPSNSADIYLIRTDADGDILWENFIGGPDEERGRSIQQTPDGGYILGGQTSSFGNGYEDFWLIRLSSEIVAVDDDADLLPYSILVYQNYPNPFNASTTIRYNLSEPSDVTVDIFDLLGRKVETLVEKRHKAGYHQTTWNADALPSGVYYYRVKAGDYSETKKMLLLK